MEKQGWLSLVEQNKQVLRSFIAECHPASPPTWADSPHLPITAPDVEPIVENIRQGIRRDAQQGLEMRPPAIQFDAAVATGDVSAIYRLIDEAWFWVPESTGCWGIPGFKEAVDLLDEPPEEEKPDGATTESL